MGMPLSEADLNEVSHIGSKRPTEPWLATRTGNNESRPLVVKLLRRQKRDEVVKAEHHDDSGSKDLHLREVNKS
ncbi:unnamed protein product [Arctia plantaginis]|uniref:Uncharacterized protein n=1 Tax=Arctia plantaginis TaxID=874455 RepID=A0A8S0Z9X1_ARCPL|nr:unnamed protein product [Arctia plantaginis]